MQAQKANEIEIVLNGEPRGVAAGSTVLSVLESLALDPARVAVEVDRAIVRRPQWTETRLHDGSRIEIVQFVGGG